MICTIQNDALQVKVRTEGAELTSVKTADGTEYLWQGDPAIWKGQAPNLFPYIARLTEGTYQLDGVEYHMAIHGFIKRSELEVEKQEEESITLLLRDNEMTRGEYPFHFEYRLTFSLDGHSLMVTEEVKNLDDRTMYFGIGGHPGFRVPLEEGLSFEDYALEFDRPCRPFRVGFTDACFLNGEDKEYALEDGRRIPLHHDLFDHDAIVLKNAARRVKICSEKGRRAVEVSYPDFPVIGFWHMPETEAPYVCVEPWSSLPSRSGIIEDLSLQSDLIHLAAGNTYRNTWTVRVIE